MADWYQHKEQSAGRFRLFLLWQIYRFFGVRALKIALVPIVGVIWCFAAPARNASRAFQAALNGPRFSTYRHMLSYSYALVDKIDASAFAKAVAVEIPDTPAQHSLLRRLRARQGVFFICGHIGNVEILPVVARRLPELGGVTFHSFIESGQSRIFFEFYAGKKQDKRHLFHPIDAIGIQTAIETQERIARGDVVIMAGDRVSARAPGKTLSADFLGHSCRFPQGVFRFARMMDCPVYFLAAIRLKGSRYRLVLEEAPPAPNDQTLLAAYTRFLEPLARNHPDQWYHFYSFFPGKNKKPLPEESGIM